jgi:hypothetical protein
VGIGVGVTGIRVGEGDGVGETIIRARSDKRVPCSVDAENSMLITSENARENKINAAPRRFILRLLCIFFFKEYINRGVSHPEENAPAIASFASCGSKAKPVKSEKKT